MSASSEVSIIKGAMNLMSKKTGGCITFVPKKSTHKNYIHIENGQGCNSYVSRISKSKLPILVFSLTIYFIS